MSVTRRDMIKALSAVSITGAVAVATSPIRSFAASANLSADGVKALTGVSPIPGAEALADGDITLMNNRVAISFAVDSDAPWGLPKGTALDVSPVVDGNITRDRLTGFDFIPNNWSDWPATDAKFTLVESGPERAVLQIERTWGEVSLVTSYTLEKDSNRILLKNVMTNNGAEPKKDLLSGFVCWPEGGAQFQPSKSGVRCESKDNPLAMSPGANKFTVAYEKDWALVLHAPYADYVNYAGKDLYLKHTLAPGETRVFEAVLEVESAGHSAPALCFAAGGPVAQGSGRVTCDKKPLKEPVIIAEQGGEMVAWELGRDGAYAMTLPEGTYELYAVGQACRPGAKKSVTLKQGKNVTLDFTDLQAPGRISFSVTDGRHPVPARISMEKGLLPEVAFLGTKTWFTKFDTPGRVDVDIAPGSYTFKVSSGAPFISEAVLVKVEVKPGKTADVKVTVPTLYEPLEQGWVAIDLHHHSDLLDGVTPPEYVALSQHAARLDYLFLSDHDTIDNLKHMDAIARKYDLAFLPGLEISPSWAHFNVFPVRMDKGLDINPAKATVQEIFAAARDLGAKVIVANHPMIMYGYLTSLDNNVIPGGFDPHFDNFEINSDGKFLQAIPRIWEYWTKGVFYPFTAGTDVHDVWTYLSGKVRLFVQVGRDKARDQDALIEGIREGRSYATMGPLVTPEVMFGSILKHEPGKELSLKYDLSAVNGLKEVALISEGKPVQTLALDGVRDRKVEFKVSPEKNTWFSLTITDREGLQAWTNPVFVNMV